MLKSSVHVELVAVMQELWTKYLRSDKIQIQVLQYLFIKYRHEQNERSKRWRNVGYVSKGKAIMHRP